MSNAERKILRTVFEPVKDTLSGERIIRKIDDIEMPSAGRMFSGREICGSLRIRPEGGKLET